MREGWEIRKLGDFSSIRSGKAIDACEISSTQSEGLFPCFGGNGIRGYVKQTIGNGVMPIIGRVGALCGNVQLTNGYFYATEHALVVSIKEASISPYWYKYALSSMRLRQFAKGVAQPVLAAKELEKLPISVPPTQEQEKIVAELNCLTGIIEKKKQQLEELDKLAQSIFYDMFGDPITNEKGWEMKKLKDVAEIVGGSTPKTNVEEYWNGQNPWVAPAELHQNHYISSTERGISNEAAKGLTLLPVGTVLLSSRAPIGKVSITTIPMYCNQGFKNVVCSNALNNEYVYHLLLNKTEYLNSLGTGATFKEISKKTTENIAIAVPPIELQEAFAAQSRAIENQKELIKRSIVETETLFNSRMDYWFN